MRSGRHWKVARGAALACAAVGVTLGFYLVTRSTPAPLTYEIEGGAAPERAVDPRVGARVANPPSRSSATEEAAASATGRSGVEPENRRLEEEPRRAPVVKRSPPQLMYDLEALVARRDEFPDTRAYWERFQQLKEQFAASGPGTAVLLEERLLSTESSPRLRRASVSLLGAIKSPSSIPVLADVLQEDPDEEVRRLAARALASYRPSAEVRQILIGELTRGETFSGSYAVVFSLSEFKNPADIPLFKSLAETHEDTSVRMQAVHALGRFEDPDLIPFLVSVWRHDRHPDPRLMAEQVIRDLQREEM